MDIGGQCVTLANDDSIKTIIKMIRRMIFMMLIHIHPNVS